MPQENPVRPTPEDCRIAYFSMEIALDSSMPTYAGGLGVLAGDTVKSAADQSLPMVAVTLLHRRGYFYQRLDQQSGQTEEPMHWVVGDHLRELPARVSVEIEGRTVHIRAWKYLVRGVSGFEVPVLLLDCDVSENSEWDRTLTHDLYGGDSHYRLCQEVVLGIGGVRMLRELGYSRLQRFHMNEGHAAMLTIELLDEETDRRNLNAPNWECVRAVQKQCVFTTHTPVDAGHDRYPYSLAEQVLRRPDLLVLKDELLHGEQLNLTFLAMSLSRYINGVAKRHGEVARHMFAEYKIDSITNGIHVASWTSPPFQELYDRHIPGWREDNSCLRYALNIPQEAVWGTHLQARSALIDLANRTTNVGMDRDVFTIGFARRATAYKRPDLLFHDVDRLNRIAERVGSIQLVFAGKAHPRDVDGKQLIRRVFDAAHRLSSAITFTWLPNYGIELAKIMTAGCDLWLNTPEPPMEASGTSGMKAAVNGVPSLSVPDGWWLEGCIEGVTGWAIGEDANDSQAREDGVKDAISLYDKLENIILPMFLNNRDEWVNIMRHCIALNGSFFNTQRMTQQYVQKAYF